MPECDEEMHRVEAMSALINYVEKCCRNMREKNAENVLIVFNEHCKNNIVFLYRTNFES